MQHFVSTPNHKADKQRIVITGMGLVTPLGCGVDRVWKRLLDGQSGIRPISLFGDIQRFKSQIAGEVPADEVVLSDYGRKNINKMGRFIRWALVAADEALADARWDVQDQPEKALRTGVMVGSGIGGLPEIEEAAVRLHDHGTVSPFFVPSALINLASGHISIAHGLRGPNLSMVTACSTGAHAIGEAAHALRTGKADVMVAGGCEAAVCPIGVGGFDAMKALSRKRNHDPSAASRPWDRDRDGFVIGEGAGVVVLETLEHARNRGAVIHGELLGYGASGDAYHMASPCAQGDGAYRCMRMALEEAGCRPEDIGYINAHGTSTPPGDLVELRTIERLFSSSTAVSSTKSSIGHLWGAAGSVEAIFTILALKNGTAPYTLNLDDPEDHTVELIRHAPKNIPHVRYALSNSFGFGGTNASLIFEKVDPAL